ncbi:2,3-butanediol dehydrogenase [Macrolepiota fuliginosa MF-IS2]|uniref:2,3-butanediol dehydrogenase n=1 Tax=Macrolepiota fuliginosa MF-IS2 TaxID=1400762 RepID=A0A9P6C4Q0_9AGAR|nr:2,3-butanediol dehydrogenase [Macrolepiota fuliginosa MF-IS2]
MRAGRYYGPGDIRVDDIPSPVPKSGQVKVKVMPVPPNGICGSDLHAYVTRVPGYPSNEPHRTTGETAPVTLGHEFSGTIVDVGPGVDATKWALGTDVAIEPIFGCSKGDCFPCSNGTCNICPRGGFIGISGWGGGLSEYIAVDLRYVHILPKEVSLEVGACIEPLAVAYYAVKRSGFTAGQTVLVVGAGPIGLFLLKVLRSIDPTGTIIVSEPAAIRREFALEHGATHVIDPKAEQVPSAVKRTIAPGVHLAFDAAGIQASLDACLDSLRQRGTYVNVAIWETKATLDVNLILAKELLFTGTLGYDRIHPEVIALVAAGKITGIEKLITRRISLDDVVEDGFKRLLNEKEKHVKILVHP